jgi:hypothetical protein
MQDFFPLQGEIKRGYFSFISNTSLPLRGISPKGEKKLFYLVELD